MTVKPSQFDALQRLVQLTDVRHQVISNNLANVNTPGYRRLDVSFEGVAAAFSSSGGAGEVPPPDQCVYEDRRSPTRADGNNVDIDRELGELGRNELLQQTLIHVLAKKLGMMRNAITGR